MYKHKEIKMFLRDNKVGMTAVTEHRVQEKLEFSFTAICGLHTIEDRSGLWADLQLIGTYQRLPWICMGDFNAITFVEDKRSGNPVQEAEIRDFNNFLIDAGMTELRLVGRSFTWTNNHVYSRIDRAVLNSEWMSKMPVFDVVVMDPYFSDHSPLCLEFADGPRTVKSFKFFNHLAEHSEFLSVIKKAWKLQGDGSTMNRVWMKLKQVKCELKKLNSSQYSGVDQRVKAIRHQLMELQEQMRDCNPQPEEVETERELRKQLEK
ncbi:uncharacterized protein [Nicotiana tomentosiformis]|uniref:uncharacterized protein n=1 Tax=Nicotiana tomentosiformis TaxID=4098 RepID=UPI00388C43F4